MSEAGDTLGRITGLATIAVFVSDLDAAKEFYVNILGVEYAGESGPGISLKAGRINIYIEGGREPVAGASDDQVRVSVAFMGDSVKAIYERLEQHGVKIVEPFREVSPTFALFKAADPDGNIFEIAGVP